MEVAAQEVEAFPTFSEVYDPKSCPGAAPLGDHADQERLVADRTVGPEPLVCGTPVRDAPPGWPCTRSTTCTASSTLTAYAQRRYERAAACPLRAKRHFQLL